jgi:hypothetical protein
MRETQATMAGMRVAMVLIPSLRWSWLMIGLRVCAAASSGAAYLLLEKNIDNPRAIRINGHQVLSRAARLTLSSPKLVNRKNVPVHISTMAAKLPFMEILLLA